MLDNRLLEMHAGEGPVDPLSRLVGLHFSFQYVQHEPERYLRFVAGMKTQLPMVFKAGFLTFAYRALSVPPMLRFG
jgi:hypothetical protein